MTSQGKEPSTRGSSPELSDALLEELGRAVSGGVYPKGDPNFTEYTKMFNGNVKTAAKAVVCPLHVQDVSNVILFCTAHSFSPSVKAGGYGTAGWAIGGDIIIDLSKIVDMDIEAPNHEGGFTSIKDMPLPGSKGKARVGTALSVTDTTSSGKRRREEDAQLRSYDSASRAVATFLHGTSSREQDTDQPPPGIRRRLDTDTPPQEATESPQASSRVSTTMSGDPFGYLGDVPSPARSQPPFVFPFAGPSTATAFVESGIFDSALDVLTHVIPVHPHAFVTFGAGKRQKEIDMFTAAHPFDAISASGTPGVVPYHVPFAAHPNGSAIMLLGGFGFLGRLYGLSIDNLVEVEMVLADGRIVIVNENEYPDLWWAIRGAGPAFGVVTRYKARAFPVPVVFAGNLIYRFHRATAPSLIKHFRDCVKGAPRELYANVLLTAGPVGRDSLVVIQMCYIGPREMGQEFLAAISSWDGEQCLLNEVDEKTFLHQQDSVAQVLRGKGWWTILIRVPGKSVRAHTTLYIAGNKWFIRSALITSLPDEIINKTVLQFADAPVGCTWLFELAGGAIADFEDTCLPKSQREASFTIATLHQWDMSLDDSRCVLSAEEWIAETLAPVTTGGPLPSFLGRQEPPGRTMACYGQNWSRLVEIKKKYDPNNVFRNSFWPLNAAGEPVEPDEHEPEHIRF